MKRRGMDANSWGLAWLVLCGALWGCGPGPQPSFLVISMDTTRPDQMSLYGYDRLTTPFIDGMATHGLVFDQAVTVAPNTLAAHASLFTGLFPAAHGVHARGAGQAVPEGAVTMAEEFLAAGYQTAGFTAHGDWLNERFGMARGFQAFSSAYRLATEVFADANTFLAARDKERPFFLFLHLFDVHSDEFERPYDAPEGFRGRYTAGYDGPLLERDDTEFKGSGLLHAIGEGDVSVGPADVEYLRGQYDEGLAAFDAQLGRFMAGHVEDFDQTYTVLLSDHGEEFMEHGRMLHGTFFDEAVRVPLVIVPLPELSSPLGEPRRIESQLSLVDLRPTLLALAGLAEPLYCQGTNWVPVLGGDRAGAMAPAFLGAEGVRFRGLKYISGLDLAPQLYDIARDPAEQTNLAEDPVFAEKRAALHGLVSDMAETSRALHRELMGVDQATPGLNQDFGEHLRALGYVDLGNSQDSEGARATQQAWGFQYVDPLALYIVSQPLVPNEPLLDPRRDLAFTIEPSLPSGITFDESTGHIAGTHREPEPGRDYTITATMEAGSEERGLILIKVRNPFARYSVQELTLYVGEDLQPLVPQFFGAAPARMRLSSEVFPGLRFDEQSGRLSGRPTAPCERTEVTLVADYEGFPSAEYVVILEVLAEH
jgi:arylsulfatase